jgi:1,2-diacylglycerol 3-beta-galactosyltransferase
MHVVIRGFVSNMEEWMGACDAIVTKAGPGTIAEALISGLPMVLNGFIPCQEAGNVPFVVDNQVMPPLPLPFLFSWKSCI